MHRDIYTLRNNSVDIGRDTPMIAPVIMQNFKVLMVWIHAEQRPLNMLFRKSVHYIFKLTYYIDGLEHGRHNSIANALELRLSSTSPSMCDHATYDGAAVYCVRTQSVSAPWRWLIQAPLIGLHYCGD